MLPLDHEKAVAQMIGTPFRASFVRQTAISIDHFARDVRALDACRAITQVAWLLAAEHRDDFAEYEYEWCIVPGRVNPPEEIEGAPA